MNNYRQSHIRNHLVLRSRILQAVRQFFIANDYLEVQTPARIPAPAPETHIDAQPSGAWYLQASPELCMKQLLAAGYSRIFQICPVFRQKERGRKHLPEFTMLEWYAVNMDYFQMMEVCESLISHVAEETHVGTTLRHQGAVIALEKPWDRLTVSAAFEKYAPISLEKALADDRFDEVITETVEPFLGIEKPVFLYDYPAERAALARRKIHDPRFGERFELYINGIEICNAFSELTDAEEQRIRFTKEANMRRGLGKDVYPMPEKFLAMLEDMPEAAGNALGLDRLVMVLADTPKIDDVTAFVPEEL